MALFESYERRIDKINSVLNSYGIASIEEAEKITKDAGLNVYDQIKGIQPICFENACWAYTVGAAIAIKKGCRRAADAAAAIGEGLQAFCIPGSVADTRKVGLGHGNLGKMLLEEETDCFCFLAGHESFAAAEGAIGIAEKANKVRKKPLRVILNGLGKDAGLNVYDQIKGIQPICFENACWAYIVGAAIAIKKDCRRAADAAAAIGEGLQAFCIPGSVADTRKVGLGHGNLGKMLLEEETECFAFLAGHESFAAAEGAIGIAEKANKVRKKPLRVILNGLGKDAAQIISRINGFTFVETE